MSSAAADYAPEIDLLGAAVIAPVVDPRELAEEISRRDPDPLLTILISWVLVPYADTYDDVRLARYIAPGSRTIVREMTQRCTAEPGAIVSVLAALGIAEDRPLYVADLTVGPLGKRLEENAARGPWPTPLLVTWGDEDEVIPPRLQEGFVQRACAQGQQVRWVVYSGYDHLRTILPRSRFLPVLLTWTEARLLGQDAPVDDCTRYGEAAP
jgi:pimeloyl-ACP methyl ester carboxylesterase